MRRGKIHRRGIRAFFIHVLLLLATAAFSANALANPKFLQPSDGSTLSGSELTFTWSLNGTATKVDRWWLYVGTSIGARDIANSGDLGLETEYDVIGIPVDGSKVHARLWYHDSRRWYYIDSSFTAANLDIDVTTPAMISPADSSELAGAKVNFEWQGNNTPVNYWWLYLGSRKGGKDIYDSGPSIRTQTSVTVDQLPVDGSSVYARLWFRTGLNGWQYADTKYVSGDGGTDGGSTDGGSDGGSTDGGSDGGSTDGGSDGGSTDGGSDGGSTDGGSDGGSTDGGSDGGSTDGGDDTDVIKNLALIKSNATRNTQFDDNAFYDVPAKDISVSDLTLNYDAYNETLLDTSNSGYFRVKCEPSHFAYDDPIVFPNQPGRAHLHMFFGNTNANAYSTYDSLLNTGTGTCNGEDLNRTSYWVPAMLDNQGNALIPDQIMVYYKNDNFRLNGANELVSPFPDNLRMLSGKASSTDPQTDFSGDWNVQPIISFSCGPAYRSNDRRQALIPDCYGNDQLEMQIAFPQCVNEAAGYQPDQSHISYSENGYYGVACPSSHPTDISSIMYRIFFKPSDYGGALTDLHLSSDIKMDKILPGGTTAHADWFGAWHPEAMDMWVENCNNTQADCETGLLDRDPAISLVPRKRNFYTRGYRAPAEELIKLCPGKTFDSANPLRSVAMCRMN